MFQGVNYDHRPAVIEPPCFQVTCPKWSRLESNGIKTLISALQDTTRHQTTSIRHDQTSYTRTQNNSTSIGRERHTPETGFHKKSTPHGRSNYSKTFQTNSFSLPYVPTIDHTLKTLRKFSYPKIFHTFPNKPSPLLPAKIQKKKRRGHTSKSNPYLHNPMGLRTT
jgi:hypothetical protein